jgi:catechol 2,3-dioxygenase-like lactoylglutathione lyase family enzyme
VNDVVTGIDHPIIAVRDMAAGRDTYQRLGFTVTPRGSHLEWGTGNWCIMFENDYIELRGIIDPKNSHNLGDFLRDREGLMGLAFGTNDAQASYDALAARGLNPQPVRQLTRNFELPEGTVQPKFALCFLDAANTPGLMSVVLCQHLTPELLRRPAWLRHANGARAVRSMTAVVPDIADAAERYARIFPPPSIERENERVTIRLNARQTISLMTRAKVHAFWPGLDAALLGKAGGLLSATIIVANISQTKQYFTTNSIAFEIVDTDRIRIAPTASCGVPLEFTDRA